MNRHLIRNLKLAVIAIVAGLAVFLIARPYFLRSSDLVWERTVAVFPEKGEPQAFIHGFAGTPLGEVRDTLLWKAGDDKWLVYELDAHGTVWDKYKLQRDGDKLIAIVNNQVADVYDPNKGELKHVREKRTDASPTAVIHGANLDHEQQWVYYLKGK